MLISVPRIPECPPPGEGVHGWILSAANHCRNAGRSATEATLLISNRITRTPNPHTEIETAITKAYGEPGGLGSIRSPLLSGLPHVTTRPLSEIQFDPERLAVAARHIEWPRNWRHWLWERSPKRPWRLGKHDGALGLYGLTNLVGRSSRGRWTTMKDPLSLGLRSLTEAAMANFSTRLSLSEQLEA